MIQKRVTGKVENLPFSEVQQLSNYIVVNNEMNYIAGAMFLVIEYVKKLTYALFNNGEK